MRAAAQGFMAKAVEAAQPEAAAPVEPAKRTRRTKAEMDALKAEVAAMQFPPATAENIAAANAALDEDRVAATQQTELPVEEPAPAPAATPAAAVPSAAETKAAAANLALVFGGEVQLGLVKHISLTFKDADGGPARLHTLTDEGRAQFFATVKECAALADKDAILKHLAV